MEQQQLQTKVPCLLSILKIVTRFVNKNEHKQNKIGREWDAEHLKSKKYHMIHARHVTMHGSEVGKVKVCHSENQESFYFCTKSSGTWYNKRFQQWF